MLTKRTSKNQVTIPKSVIQHFEDTEYFDAFVKDGAIVLTPVSVVAENKNLENIREKIKELGITDKDIHDAIAWARKRKAR